MTRALHRMSSIVAMSVCALGAALWMMGCGGKRVTPYAPRHRIGLPRIETKYDADHDADSYPGTPDDERQAFGRPADAADTRAITALVKRYYAAAVRHDGGNACRLLYLPLLESLTADPGSDASRDMRGTSCLAVLTKLFRFDKWLGVEATHIRIVVVRVDINRASVRFKIQGRRSDRYLMVHRQRHRWKIDMLLDVGEPVGEE
jgi:hypothetical protein